MNKNLVIIGGGGHAKVLIALIQRTNQYDLVGYVDIQDKGNIYGIPYLGNDAILDSLIAEKKTKNIVMGISYLEHNPLSSIRAQMISKLKDLGFYLPTILSQNAFLNKPKSIGEGTVVFDGAIINADALIGDFCVINSGATIEHDCILAENVQIAPQTVLCGGVKIGSNSYIGANSVVINNVEIGENILIGAGSTVIRNISEPGVYVGNPIRKVR